MIRHYSEFVTHPVYLREVKTIQVPKKQEETEKSDEEKKDDIDDIEDVEEMEEEEEKEPEMEDITTFEDVHINTDPAIWARDKDEITDEEYQEFWKVVSKEGGDAADWSHFNAE
jgi:heat shock protein beta